MEIQKKCASLFSARNADDFSVAKLMVKLNEMPRVIDRFWQSSECSPPYTYEPYNRAEMRKIDVSFGKWKARIHFDGGRIPVDETDDRYKKVLFSVMLVVLDSSDMPSCVVHFESNSPQEKLRLIDSGLSTCAFSGRIEEAFAQWLSSR